MQFDQYTQKIEESIYSNEFNSLTTLKEEINNDPDLSNDQMFELESKIESILAGLSEANKQLNSNESKESSYTEEVWLPIKYSFSDVITNPKGMNEFNPNKLPYPIWFRDVYLPTFHPMPDPHVQYPLITCISLMNCNAVLSESTIIPMFYFLGMRGSGKTLLANQILQHYPSRCRLSVYPSWTGSAIRDEMDKCFVRGEPGITLFDNFNPNLSINRMGPFYTILLANSKSFANEGTKLSTKAKGGEERGEYALWCNKGLTSIFPLSESTMPEVKEIERRCLIFTFQKSEPEQSTAGYDWSEMRDEYKKIWSDRHRVVNEYGKSLASIIRLRPNELPIKGSNWENCQVPIATGVFTGIFKNIHQGIDAFAEYYDWVTTAKVHSAKDSTTSAIDSYINDEYPLIVSDYHKSFMYESNITYMDDPNVKSFEYIEQLWIENYIKQTSGFKPGKRDLDTKITPYMLEKGYKLEQIRRKNVFVKY